MVTLSDPTVLHDTRVNCMSMMTAMSVDEYLSLAGDAYKKRGGLEHQRDTLKTTTARRIRARMVDDIRNGAVLPPVVIGIVADNDFIKIINSESPTNIVNKINEIYVASVSIIDGMQRTTALFEARKEHEDELGSKPIRVEFWVAESIQSLIYRMLVLNTGQVPWNISRQLQVVYAPLIEELRKKVSFTRILNTNTGERRSKAGEYAPDNLAELYIAFGLRKTDIDTQETLADEFSRLDMTEAIASQQYEDFFYPVIQMLVDLDVAFSRFDGESALDPDEGEVRIRKGRSIFDRKPARIGFVVAIATEILGRVGMKQDEDKGITMSKLETVKSDLQKLVAQLNEMDAGEIGDFLRLDVLSERLLGQKRSAVGRYERAFFDSAFKVLISEKFDVPSMEPCWRA